MKITDWLANLFPQQHPRKTAKIQPAAGWVEVLENRVLLSSQNVLVQSLTSLEGTSLDDVPIQFALTEGSAPFEEMGFFLFDDDGTVNGLNPGDDGFSDAVIDRGTTVFEQGAALGSATTFVFNGGNQIGVYFCHNRPASEAVNEIDQQMLSDNTFRLGFEETPSLWPTITNENDSLARQFDDAVVQVTIGGTVTFGRPNLSPIGDRTTREEELFQLQVTASNPEGPNSDLRYRLDTAPDGASIDEMSGLLTWTPTEEQGPGSFEVTVTVFNSTRPDAATSRTFTINVTEVNTAPTIDPIDDATINEQEPFTVTATGSNPFGPDSDIRFRLDQAPAGVTIDEMTGEINWTPTEEQGPGRFDIVVAVFNVTDPADSNTETFTVDVAEVNVAPVIAAIPDQDVNQGEMVSVQVAALVTDADLPANQLSYSLLNNSIPDAQIDSNSGVFTWTPSTTGTFTFTVRVVDNGNPQLAATQDFLVTVS